MNVACDYEAPMQMLTTEKYIPSGSSSGSEINFFGYSPVGRVAIKIYSPVVKITRPSWTAILKHRDNLTNPSRDNQ